MCDCGPQSSGGSCVPTDAGSSGCNIDGGLVANQPDVSTYTGDDGGPDATEDSEAGDATVFGICNGVLCPAGCSCDLVDDDAGGGVACECAGEAGAGDGGDAGDGGPGDAATDALAPDAASALDASDGATGLDASVGDAGGHTDALDATTDAGEAIPCGVITCGMGCACISVAASQCECP